jgi:hypothetical protein
MRSNFLQIRAKLGLCSWPLCVLRLRIGHLSTGADVSNTDSFIEEVTEEVRRDRLFGLIRKYGWIAITAVILIVGGAAYREYVKAQRTAAAQDFGSSVLAALEQDDAQARVDALDTVAAPNGATAAIVAMMQSAELVSDGQSAAAITRLEQAALDPNVDQSYRDLVNFKRLMRADSGLDTYDRVAGFTPLATPGNPLRLLATEQLAVLDLETGDIDAAIERYNAILNDAEITQGLRQRVTQVMIALGQDVTN